MTTAIIPFSGDPITHGHVNIIDRALQVFDRVIVAIGINPTKKYTFSTEEREALARSVLWKYGERVSVKSFTGLLMDFAYEQNVKTIVRGARNTIDVAMEQMLNDVNRAAAMGIDTFLIFADQNLGHISSSAAKEIQKGFGKNILDYVPMAVKEALENKMCGQFRLGVTGEIGAGKSMVTNKLIDIIEHSDVRYIEMHNIDLDVIGRRILTEATAPIYRETRKELSLLLGIERQPTGFFFVGDISRKIFFDEGAREIFNEVMFEPMNLMLRQEIIDKKGIVIINSALLAEADILGFVNNKVLLVTASEPVRRSRLALRNYSPEEIDNRMDAQLCAAEKTRLIQEKIERDGYGCLMTLDNSKDISEMDGDLNDIAIRIKTVLGVPHV
jgi:pantetheine-phosphate adenylyltransferase